MIDLSDYSCDKCAREFSRHCKYCYHTANKAPTKFKRKKKTGVQTPEFRKPTMPTPIPPLPVTELPSRRPRSVAKFAIDTEDKFDVLMTNYPDAIKVEDATIYWSDDKMALLVVAPQEWKDCLFEGKALPTIKKSKSDTIETISCDHETLCGWCCKWDKKCDKKICDEKPQRGLRAKANIYDDAIDFTYGKCFDCKYEVGCNQECNPENNFKYFQQKE